MRVLNKNLTDKLDATVTVRTPMAKDGQKLYKLAKEAGGLDVNSEYAYLLLGTHFSKTCAFMEENSKPLGFVSAYILQDHPDTLFIWQVAIDRKHRKRGLAKTMIKDILNRDVCQTIRYLQATITPSNIASQKFFESLSRDLGAEFTKLPLFNKELFFEEHEEEFLIQIGPFSQTNS